MVKYVKTRSQKGNHSPGILYLSSYIHLSFIVETIQIFLGFFWGVGDGD